MDHDIKNLKQLEEYLRENRKVSGRQGDGTHLSFDGKWYFGKRDFKQIPVCITFEQFIQNNPWISSWLGIEEKAA